MPNRNRRTILVRLGKFKAMDKYQRVSLIPNLLLDFKKLHDKKQADSGAEASNHGSDRASCARKGYQIGSQTL
jgi:hypothetical protein